MGRENTTSSLRECEVVSCDPRFGQFDHEALVRRSGGKKYDINERFVFADYSSMPVGMEFDLTVTEYPNGRTVYTLTRTTELTLTLMLSKGVRTYLYKKKT